MKHLHQEKSALISHGQHASNIFKIHSYWAFSMILAQVQQLKHQVLDMLRSNGQVSHTLPEPLQKRCIAACLPSSKRKLSALNGWYSAYQALIGLFQKRTLAQNKEPSNTHIHGTKFTSMKHLHQEKSALISHGQHASKIFKIHSYWAFSMILAQVQQLKHQMKESCLFPLLQPPGGPS